MLDSGEGPEAPSTVRNHSADAGSDALGQDRPAEDGGGRAGRSRAEPNEPDQLADGVGFGDRPDGGWRREQQCDP